MSRLLYISVHGPLAYDEVRLFENLGFIVDVASQDGQPCVAGHDRPAFGNPVAWDETSISCYDIIIIMHDIDALMRIWKARRSRQRIIWRTIGQSSPHHERFIREHCRGVEIVRYSPSERFIDGFAGETAIIRFCKDSNELSGWVGGENRVLVARNNFLKRGYVDDVSISKALMNLPWDLFGFGNEWHPHSVIDTSYPTLLDAMRRYDVFFATHSVPASYTLNLIEAMMVGMPVVALARDAVGVTTGAQWLTELGRNLYEVDDIIENSRNGFLVSDAYEGHDVISRLLRNEDLRREIGAAGRETAVRLFDHHTIGQQWWYYLEKKPISYWLRFANVKPILDNISRIYR